MRAAKIDQDSLRLYTARLVKENAGDVICALQKLAEMPRENFETAMPDLATILALVSAEGVSRQNRSEAARSQRLVLWECPDCGTRLSGFPSAGQSLERRCNGIPKDNRTDVNAQGQRICGARLKVVLDDNGGADTGPLEQWHAPDWVTR